MTVETILLVLAVSASGRVSGELEEKRITFRDPEHGAVERLYLQLLPASYGDPGLGTLVPLVLDFHGYIVSRDWVREYFTIKERAFSLLCWGP